MSVTLQEYARITGDAVIDQLYQLSNSLKGKKVVHVNSTRMGGGVAEILDKLVPLMNELGIETSWEVINGDAAFYQCTKGFHNALQGNTVNIPEVLLKAYESTNYENFMRLEPELKNADIVIIHDPQPAPFLSFCPDRKGKWIWRCHIDLSRHYRPVWKYIRNFVTGYDASIFSLDVFSQQLPHPQYLISPSIDPLSDKNVELPENEINAIYSKYQIDPERPLITQISRYDRFKDPIGVIQAFKIARKFVPDLQLVLAGGGATDDPEGEAVLNEVYSSAGDDPDIHVLLLPPDAHRTINALQRASDIVLQKSIKEGFGLTVTEAMWKGKPVIGGKIGGIRLQVHNHQTGFLVETPEGAALRIRYLYFNRDIMAEMGNKAHRLVLENFLITRHLREYLTLMAGLLHGNQNNRIELG